MKSKMEVKGNIYTYGIYGMKVKGTEEYLYIGSGEINDCLSRHLHNLKRGLYETTNKIILQRKYDMDVLEFEVIHESEQKENYKIMTPEEKEQLSVAMSVLEQFYINLYKHTVCNVQKTVTRHSSNKDGFSTMRRSKSNTGANNPNCKYSEQMIREILWLKMNGYKAKQIEEMYVNIKANYINMIGIKKWIHLEPIKPNFINETYVQE